MGKPLAWPVVEAETEAVLPPVAADQIAKTAVVTLPKMPADNKPRTVLAPVKRLRARQ
jgi:hypothetical protein